MISNLSHLLGCAVLHAETLATLSAAAGQNATAALRRHTGTEAVALCTLTLVRLIGALHDLPFRHAKTGVLWCRSALVLLKTCVSAIFSHRITPCKDYLLLNPQNNKFAIRTA